MEKVEDLTDQKLAQQYQTYHQKVELGRGGVGTSDLRRYSSLQKEVEKRGFEIRTKVEIENNQGRKLVGGEN